MLITSITPLRVSFLGGGSDYKDFYANNEYGFVFGTTIDLYVYTSVIRNSSLAGHRFKISYRELDECNDVNEIRHPVVKAVLNTVGWEDAGLHISTMADVPAGTGLGSSSSFTVGLINLINQLRGENYGLEDVVQQAIHIERNVLCESGGIQDQYHATYGGLTSYRFSLNGTTIKRITDSQKIEVLSKSMYLVPVGIPRNSHNEAAKWLEISKSKKQEIQDLRAKAEKTFDEFNLAQSGAQALNILSYGMNESWEIKRRLKNFGPKSQNETLVDNIILAGKKAGALAGKLCGAGGSGFVLFLVDESAQDQFQTAFEGTMIRKIRIDPKGSRLERYTSWQKEE